MKRITDVSLPSHFLPGRFTPTDISSQDVSPSILQKCRRFTPFIENDLTK